MPRQQPGRQEAPAKPVENSEQLLDKIMSDTVSNIDKTAERFKGELHDPTIGQFIRAIKKAKAIEILRKMIMPTMPLIRSLMNTPMGFLTDEKPDKPYTDEVLRDCVIEAMLSSVSIIGNEFNIISGKCYITQAGYKSKLENLPGLTDLDVTPGVPAMYNGQMVCRVRAQWKLNGMDMRLIGADNKDGRAFPIKVGSGSTPDNTTGKALRKGYKAVYEKCTGSKITEPDDEPETVPMPAATPKDDGELADKQLLDQMQFHVGRTGLSSEASAQMLVRHGCTDSRTITVTVAKAIIRELEALPMQRQAGDEE